MEKPCGENQRICREVLMRQQHEDTLGQNETGQGRDGNSGTFCWVVAAQSASTSDPAQAISVCSLVINTTGLCDIYLGAKLGQSEPMQNCPAVTQEQKGCKKTLQDWHLQTGVEYFIMHLLYFYFYFFACEHEALNLLGVYLSNSYQSLQVVSTVKPALRDLSRGLSLITKTWKQPKCLSLVNGQTHYVHCRLDVIPQRKAAGCQTAESHRGNMNEYR